MGREGDKGSAARCRKIEAWRWKQGGERGRKQEKRGTEEGREQ